MTGWREAGCCTQVRTFDLVQKDKVFAIGYCFGGGGVLELMRAWPSTPGLLGEPHYNAHAGLIMRLACACALPTHARLAWTATSPPRSDTAACGLLPVSAPRTCLHRLTAVDIFELLKQLS